MKMAERNEIIRWAKILTDKELEEEFYRSLNDVISGDQTEDMYEQGYEMIDIQERYEYQKFLSEKCDLLLELCNKRGIDPFQEENKYIL